MVGVAIGAVVTRVLTGRGAPAEPAVPAPVATPPAEPEPAVSVPAPPPPAVEPVAAEVVAPPEAVAEPAVEPAEAAPEAAEASSEPAAEAAQAPAEPEPAAADPAEKESLGGGVEDVVAELERRYKGRRADGEPDRPGNGRGQRS